MRCASKSSFLKLRKESTDENERGPRKKGGKAKIDGAEHNWTTAYFLYYLYYIRIRIKCKPK